jgi:ethanolamine ammonia-lyase large subunit
MKRRTFLVGGAAAAGATYGVGIRAAAGAAQTAPPMAPALGRVSVDDVKTGEDLFAWLNRVHGSYDAAKYRQLLGAANPFKEGDDAQGVAAADDESRANCRRLLANTTIAALLAHPVFQDEVVAFADAQVDAAAQRRIERWTVGELVRFLLDRSEDEIRAIMPGLASDTIACAVKLMSNDELVAVGRKVFNPLPGSKVGARGYMGARIQPNSPTDDPEDIVMQVLDGWSYACGDVVLGTNPVSSDVDQVAKSKSRCAICWRHSASSRCSRTACSRTSTCRIRSNRSTADRPRSGSRAWPASPTPTRCSTSTSRRCGGTRRSGPGRSASTSRPARAPTPPTATARASTW